MPTDAHAIFLQHQAEREFWREVAANVQRELETVVLHLRLPAKVESRSKSSGSVFGKAFRKPDAYGELGAFRDLAAARVLVPFESMVTQVVDEISGHPDFVVVLDDKKSPKPDALGYSAHHVDVEVTGALLPDDVPFDASTRPVICEIQIHTFAQSLWASVTHLVTYKREDLPENVLRRVNRLVALVELFDSEITAARSDALQDVDDVFLIAAELVNYFRALTGTDSDLTSTAHVVADLLDAVAESDRTAYPSILERFLETHGDRLRFLLNDRPEVRELPWLLRPESILIFERIVNSPTKLRSAWGAKYEARWLEEMEDVWGLVD
jgi:ppGpp synthetase/RelA/SpoT-type nucleotidyltranferase